MAAVPSGPFYVFPINKAPNRRSFRNLTAGVIIPTPVTDRRSLIRVVDGIKGWVQVLYFSPGSSPPRFCAERANACGTHSCMDD